MKVFEYKNETFAGVKGHSINVGNLEAFTCAYTKGFYRFRVFGYGALFKDLTLFNKTLCELTGKGVRFGRWYFRFISL